MQALIYHAWGELPWSVVCVRRMYVLIRMWPSRTIIHVHDHPSMLAFNYIVDAGGRESMVFMLVLVFQWTLTYGQDSICLGQYSPSGKRKQLTLCNQKPH